MAEQTAELMMPAHLDEIKGTTKEVLAIKSQLISKFGYPAWEKLVAASARTTKR